MTHQTTPSAEAELEEILDAIGVVKLADGNWTIDKRGAEHKLLAWSERQAAQRVKAALECLLENTISLNPAEDDRYGKDYTEEYVYADDIREAIAALQSSEAEQQENKE